MPSIRIYMDTTEKQNSRRRNIIGGGKRIVCSINCPSPRITLVWFFSSRRIITSPRISCTFSDWWNAPVNTPVKDATFYPWAPISKLIIILPTSAERWETRPNRTNHPANHTVTALMYLIAQIVQIVPITLLALFVRCANSTAPSLTNMCICIYIYWNNWNSIAIHCFSNPRFATIPSFLDGSNIVIFVVKFVLI